MDAALGQAGIAFDEGEVPVGAVLRLADGREFPARNATRGKGQPGSHAEHTAIEEACRAVGDWRLDGSLLVCTLEPCLMCAGLCVLARVGRIVYAARDTRFGAFGSVADVSLMRGLDHYPVVEGGLGAEESAALLKRFFRDRRAGAPVRA
jgi:tRNA(adenine34) deaminase